MHAHKYLYGLGAMSNVCSSPCRQVYSVLILSKSCILEGIFLTFSHFHCLFSSNCYGITLFYWICS